MPKHRRTKRIQPWLGCKINCPQFSLPLSSLSASGCMCVAKVHHYLCKLQKKTTSGGRFFVGALMPWWMRLKMAPIADSKTTPSKKSSSSQTISPLTPTFLLWFFSIFNFCCCQSSVGFERWPLDHAGRQSCYLSVGLQVHYACFYRTLTKKMTKAHVSLSSGCDLTILITNR